MQQPCWGKIPRYHFLQPPGSTQTLGSPIRERSRSPLEGTPSLVPGTELLSNKWKTSDKENLPYFRIWKNNAPTFTISGMSAVPNKEKEKWNMGNHQLPLLPPIRQPMKRTKMVPNTQLSNVSK
ncbi:hypothetical protein YC2023_041966 [Brassica napus]